MARLHDLAALQRHPLAAGMDGDVGQTQRAAGVVLRERIMAAVEQLRPAAATAAAGRGSRRYDLLTLRYVEQQEIDEVCTRLGISRGFYFREHNAALDAVAALLGAALNVTAPAPRERPARNNMALVKIPEPEVEASAAPAPAAPPLPQRAPLVGREKEFAALLDQVQMARQGSGRVALLGGAPGVGKTRLVQELGRLVTAEGGMFLEGQFTREAGIQHFPWVDVLRTGLQSVGAGEMAQVIGPFGPHLAAILPEFAGTAGSPSPAGSPLDERRALYDGITHVVTQLAQRTPVVVIVIDDMQWAAGLSLFEHVARRLERARVLLIGVYRDQELQQESALFAQHVGLLRLPHATGLPLSPLTLTETTELATHFVGSGPATTLAARLFSRTRGNPYFITEVLRSLGDRRGLHWDGAAWRLQEPVQLALPDSIKMLIDQWAARAGTVADRLLRQAAVLGLEFSVPALREMSGLPDDALAEALDASETARLIRDQTAPGEEQYAFSDDQVQEVLYDGLPGAQRRRLHQRAGDAYEAVYAKDTAPWVEELARHFAEGGSPAKGAAYAIQAGRRAEQVFDGERAAMHYTTALGLLRAQGAPAAELAALCERLAIVYTETPAAHMPSLPLLDEALALYRQAGDVRREARIHVRLGRERLGGNRGVTRHMAASREHLETARTLLEPLGAGRELVETYAYLSVLMPQILQFEASLRWADQAIAVYQTVSAGKLGGIGIAASLALVCRGDNLAGWAMIEEAWSDARDTRSVANQDQACAYAVWIAAAIKAPRLAQLWADRVSGYATAGVSVTLQWYLMETYARAGNLSAARRILDDIRSAIAAIEEPEHIWHPHASGTVLLCEGRWEEARALLEAGLEWNQTIEYRLMAVQAAHRLGEVLLELGQPEQAERHLLWALALAREAKAVMLELAVLPALCEAAVRTGALDQAEERLRRAQEILEGPGPWGGLPGDVLAAEARVLGAQGQHEEAAAAFVRAVDFYGERGLVWDQARTYEAWGDALAEWRQSGAGDAMLPGDAAECRWRQAQELWGQMGAAPYADRCQEKLLEERGGSLSA